MGGIVKTIPSTVDKHVQNKWEIFELIEALKNDDSFWFLTKIYGTRHSGKETRNRLNEFQLSVL